MDHFVGYLLNKRGVSFYPGIIPFVFIMSFTYSAYTQTPGLLKLPAHTELKKVDWRDSIYRFPEFMRGRITFATGFSPEGTARLNYNLYFAQVDIINEKGDTLQVTPSKEVKLIDIGGHTFYYDDRWGYIEVLSNGPVALGVLTVLSTEKMVYVSGSFDGASAGIDTRGTRSVYDRYYRKTDTYFFVDSNNKLYKAIKPSILKVYASHKKEINEYVNEHKTDFNKMQDLLQLLNFCNQL